MDYDSIIRLHGICNASASIAFVYTQRPFMGVPHTPEQCKNKKKRTLSSQAKVVIALSLHQKRTNISKASIVSLINLE